MNSSTAPSRACAPGARDAAAVHSKTTFHIYRVRISTGDQAGAGTDSRIFLTLVGTAGRSSEMELLDSLAGDNKFERGKTDEFALRSVRDVGDITRIVVRSDASALGSDWLLSRVVVTNCRNNNEYTFDCRDFWICDVQPHEFICSERIKRDLQLEHVADNSGLLLSARLPIVGKRPAPHFPRAFACARDELLEESELALEDVTCVALADYLGAGCSLDAVSMYVEHALKLHPSQVSIRPIHWRISSRLRGAAIILPDHSTAQSLVQYCSAQWAATTAMPDGARYERHIDSIEPIQDNPIAVDGVLARHRAAGDVDAIIGCLWALGPKATRAHYLQALKACGDGAMGRTAIALLSDQFRLKLRVDVDAYNTVMHSLRGEDVCFALGVYNLMATSGVSINERTLRVLFRALDAAGEWEHALRVLKRADGLTFDGEMFTSAISVCQRGKAVPAVVALLDQMKLLGLKADSRILIASLHCCIYSNHVALLRWLLSEDAVPQLTPEDVLALIAAAKDLQQYACLWELQSLAFGANTSLPPSAALAMLVAAARTQHHEDGVRIWRSLAQDVAEAAAAEDSAVLEAAVKCLQQSGQCHAACALYRRSIGCAPTPECSSAAMRACLQLSASPQALEFFESLPEDHKVACDVQGVARAAQLSGGHAAVCQLFLQHFSDRWQALDEAAQGVFLSSLHDQHYEAEAAALLALLQSKGAASPRAALSCIPILTARGQWSSVIDSYFIIKSAGLSVPPHIYSCVIAACAGQAVSFPTLATLLKGARLCSRVLPASDWDNAMVAASRSASAAEMLSLASEAGAAGHVLGAASTAALLLATNERGGVPDVVKLLKLLPMPLPKQSIAAAATALVKADLWNDALAVLEGSSRQLSLEEQQTHDFEIIARCSELFKAHGVPTDASFTKAALHCRCAGHISAGESSSAAHIVMPALRSGLADAHTCVQVILALSGEAERAERSGAGGSAGGLVQQRLRAEKAAKHAAALREQAIQVFELAREVFEAGQLSKAADSVIACLHRQEQPRALVDALESYLNTGQKLCDRSYAAAVLANEALGMHERALALLNEIHNRDSHLTALRAGSRCAMACGQRRLALELHAESVNAEQLVSADNIGWGDGGIIPPAITPPALPHSPGKSNRHASVFPSHL